MKPRVCVPLAAALVLCACSTAPLTILSDRQIYSPVHLNRYPVLVEAVDRRGNLDSPVFLEPGLHVVTIAAPPQRGFREPVEKTFTLNLAACTRYYIAADRVNPLVRDWTLVIENVEPVAGCDPALEWQKAKRQAPEGAPGTGAAVIISG